MIFKKIAILGLVSIVLTGCLSTEQLEKTRVKREIANEITQEKREQARQAKIKEQQKEFQEIRAIPTCSSEQECKTKWDAAQLWVTKNADFKIRIANDVMIETFSSVSKDTAHDSYVLITKEPLGDGKYLIKPMIKCESRLFCFKSSDDQKRKFNNYVNSFN